MTWAVTSSLPFTSHGLAATTYLGRVQKGKAAMKLMHCLFLAISSFRTFAAVTRVQIPSGTPNLSATPNQSRILCPGHIAETTLGGGVLRPKAGSDASLGF